jgi:hypothetical protein
MRTWTLFVIKTRQLLSERESQSALIICRVCTRRFFQFPVMITNNKKWRSTSWLLMLNLLFSFPTFLLFSPFRLVTSNTWVQWKHLTPERSIDLCLQTFPKLLLLLVPKVTTRSSYPECIANLKLPIDAFYRESRSGVNIAKRNITTGLFGLQEDPEKTTNMSCVTDKLTTSVRIGTDCIGSCKSNYHAITATTAPSDVS